MLDAGYRISSGGRCVIPNPCSYDSESEFVSACIAERQDENPSEDTDQSAAVCYSMWRERDCDKAMRSKTKPSGPIIKAGETLSVGEREAIFIASTSAPDRLGDVVEQNWDLRAFRKNPLFLFQHPKDDETTALLPIGKISKIWTENDKTFIRAEAPPEGWDDFADKVWKFLKAGFLNAVSVGFNPVVEPKERVDKKSGRWLGWIFPKNELLEVSLVRIPAHPEALAIARSFDMNERDLEAVFEQPKGVHAGVSKARRFVEIQRLRVST